MLTVKKSARLSPRLKKLFRLNTIRRKNGFSQNSSQDQSVSFYFTLEQTKETNNSGEEPDDENDTKSSVYSSDSSQEEKQSGEEENSTRLTADNVRSVPILNRSESIENWLNNLSNENHDSFSKPGGKIVNILLPSRAPPPPWLEYRHLPRKPNSVQHSVTGF